MKALITGGAGFIGSHIAELLISKGYEVAVVDDLSNGSRRNVSQKAKLHILDITDMKKLDEAFKKEKPDFVLHHAAQINVRRSVENPALDMKINAMGTLNVLECCRRHGVKKMVFAGSGGAVYGEPKELPCTEEHPAEPLSPYGVSKLAAEHYIRLYGALHGLNYVILRYSNVYGPRQNPKGEAGVVAIFSERMLNGTEITIFGDGRQARDFVFVKDVARANLLALEKEPKSRIINIGSGKEYNVLQLHEELKKVISRQHKVRFADAIPGEVRRIFLDISRAKKELGWEPQVGFAEGLKETVSTVLMG